MNFAVWGIVSCSMRLHKLPVMLKKIVAKGNAMVSQWASLHVTVCNALLRQRRAVCTAGRTSGATSETFRGFWSKLLRSCPETRSVCWFPQKGNFWEVRGQLLTIPPQTPHKLLRRPSIRSPCGGDCFSLSELSTILDANYVTIWFMQPPPLAEAIWSITCESPAHTIHVDDSGCGRACIPTACLREKECQHEPAKNTDISGLDQSRFWALADLECSFCQGKKPDLFLTVKLHNMPQKHDMCHPPI